MKLLTGPLVLMPAFVCCVGVALPITNSQANQGAKKESNSASTRSVEVRWTSGSIVVMTLLQDQIEVATDYGKLNVPAKDIRSIEFGVRTSDEERRKIEDAIRRLSNNAFNDRESASRELVAFGPKAFVRVQRAASDETLEAAKRAETVLSTIRERHPARLLRGQEDDVVRTTKFSIVGRVTTPIIKAKAEDFGELELRPDRLLAIRSLTADAKKEVVIDAATYGGQGDPKWLDTGVRCDPLIGLKVSATGQVDLWPQQPGQYMSSPDGQGGGWGGGMAMGNFRGGRRGAPTGSGGELVGRIGENGAPFVIGSRFTKTPKSAGKLYLQIVPSPWGNPSTGEYRVSVSLGNFAEDGDSDD